MYYNSLDQCVSLVSHANILICKDLCVVTMMGEKTCQIVILSIVICRNGSSIDQVLCKLSENTINHLNKWRIYSTFTDPYAT